MKADPVEYIKKYTSSERYSDQLMAATFDMKLGTHVIDKIARDLFRFIDADNTGRIGVNEATRIIFKLNSLLGKTYGRHDINAFLKALDINEGRTIDFNGFKNAFMKC